MHCRFGEENVNFELSEALCSLPLPYPVASILNH